MSFDINDPAARIGRDIDGQIARPKHQLAMVMDLNKCIGCHSCSVACKQLWTGDEGREGMWWNTVNTMPGQGTPKGWETMGGGFRDGAAQPGRIPTRKELGEAWEFNHEEVFFGGQGNKVHLKPKGATPQWGPNWDEDQGGGEYPNSFYFYLPRICNHCTHPACLEACPRGAIKKREEDGIVLVDEDHCKGYRFCVEACPYKKMYYNALQEVANKCILCLPRVEKGVATACTRQCPARVRFFGFLDDESSAIYRLVERWKVAVPLHPEYGTAPNVFYIPPLSPALIDEHGAFDVKRSRIPEDYLRSLFGEAGIDALATLAAEMRKARSGGQSELIDTLVSIDWSDMLGGFDRDPSTIRWVKS
jgi:ethylbenzene hydroxylase subunit beta/complex iron-sulfur molybdoenzyme family reductase subunit beta